MDLRLLKLTSALSVALLLLFSAPALAQDGGDDDDPVLASGVFVDAQGVLKMQRAADPTGQLMRQRIQQAASTLPPELNRPSKLRQISLNRLEKAVAERSEQRRAGKEAPK